MDLKLSTTLEKEVEGAVREFDYKDEMQFIEDALRRRLLSLKRSSFLSSVEGIRESMERQAVSEQDILTEFETFRHSTA